MCRRFSPSSSRRWAQPTGPPSSTASWSALGSVWWPRKRANFAVSSPQMRGGGRGESENVVVAAEFLRRGIANELVRNLVQRAETEAASAILLEVRESNLPARGLYEKHGFREVGRRQVYYNDPTEDAILYTLRFEL